jgi:katanin p60 ATPase-containing subunit A1
VQQIIDMGILVREPNVKWDSIAGLVAVKKLLRTNLVVLPMRPDIAKGLLAPWKTVLFYGPPGTGKTYLAKAVATECKRQFFNVTSATITSRWHGESEKLIAYLFALAAEMRPSTIFFDEIDSIASQRGTGTEHEASRRMKAQLLTSLEGADSVQDSSVFVLAATNFPWDLDEALLRRFQKRIYIPLPDAEAREAILRAQLLKEGEEYADGSLDFAKWAAGLDGYSCSDITNLCRDVVQALFEKAASGLGTIEWVNLAPDAQIVKVTNADFEAALARRKPSVDRRTLQRYEEWRREKGAD